MDDWLHEDRGRIEKRMDRLEAKLDAIIGIGLAILGGLVINVISNRGGI